MKAVVLIMGIEGSSFLFASCFEIRRIHVEHHLRTWAQRKKMIQISLINGFKRFNGFGIHSLVEPGKGRLGSQLSFSSDRRKYRLCTQFVSLVVRVVASQVLVDFLNDHLYVGVNGMRNRVFDFEPVLNQLTEACLFIKFPRYRSKPESEESAPPEKSTFTFLLN
ncbi:hypothetical protein QS257_11960 [Terrilactibacillus sp. S3-3]|nr:hypothetical protein QS257_11960 [Terrilactibacillus sp. S3-3]